MSILDEDWKWRGMKPVARLATANPECAQVNHPEIPQPESVKQVKEIRPLAARALAEIVEDLIDYANVPERNCSCFISPPCNDCVENGYIREQIELAQDLIKEIRS